jgi:hypothetical protein
VYHSIGQLYTPKTISINNNNNNNSNKNNNKIAKVHFYVNKLQKAVFIFIFCNTSTIKRASKIL